MSGFSAQWLALRENVDASARSDAPAQAVNDWLDTVKAVNIMDLGCGSGSNLRWLSPRIAATQSWHLLDNDPQLLAQAARALGEWAGVENPQAQIPQAEGISSTFHLHATLTARLTQLDLGTQLPTLDDVHLLSASALLDLVSRPWLATLVRESARRRIGLLFALNYDGRVRFVPTHADDAVIRDAVNRDQHGDKGFGPALGPDCVAAFTSECATRGYRVQQWRSDWHLGNDEQAVHAQLVDDFARIARRRLPARNHHSIESWHRWREDARNNSTLHIGHVDILALPPSTQIPQAQYHPG